MDQALIWTNIEGGETVGKTETWKWLDKGSMPLLYITQVRNILLLVIVGLQATMLQFTSSLCNRVLTKGARLPGCSPQTPQNRNFKNKDYVDTMLSEVLRDLPFSRNQPLKSADVPYFRILKNKLIK